MTAASSPPTDAPAGEPEEVANGASHSLLERLIAASIAGCTCDIKTPEISFHAVNCPYAACAMALEVVRLKNDRIDQKSAALTHAEVLLAEAREALRLLLHEVEQSGNATAKDYGWPAAVEACRTVIEKIRGVS